MPSPSGSARSASRGPSRALQAARWSTSIAFLLTGFVFATWAARIPALKADLGLTDSQLAIALVGLNAGAVVGLQLGSVVVTRFGSRRSLMVTLPAFAGSLLPIGFASNLAGLTVAVAVSAGINSVVDVAINDQGVGVQHGYGRSLLTGMHAMHSLGGVLGGAVAAVAAHLGLGVVSHFALVMAAVVTVAVLSNRTLLPPEQLHGDHARGPGRHRCGPAGPAGCSFSARWRSCSRSLKAARWTGAPCCWPTTLAPPPPSLPLAWRCSKPPSPSGVCSATRSSTASAQSVSSRPGALLAGAGFATGLLLGNTASAIAGLAFLGLGLATLLPISISAAGTIPGLPVPVAVARVSTLGYLGTFTGPALIGFLSHHTDLPTALLLPAFAIAATAVAAPAVRRPHPRDERAMDP